MRQNELCPKSSTLTAEPSRFLTMDFLFRVVVIVRLSSYKKGCGVPGYGSGMKRPRIHAVLDAAPLPKSLREFTFSFELLRTASL